MAAAEIEFDQASFRDPAGRVLQADGRILRAVAPAEADELRRFLASAFYAERTGSAIVATRALDSSDPSWAPVSRRFGALGGLFEHDRLEVITYPYEWPFALLRKAALFHLDMHRQALAAGFDLIDASAYNVQFRGVQPIFLDVLSFRSYREGGYWLGYKQFCEQFLAPLLLTADRGIPFHDWYRGSLDGIDLRHLAHVLSIPRRWFPRELLHVVWHARLIERIDSSPRQRADRRISSRGLSRTALSAMLGGLSRWVRGLQPKGYRNTYWRNYQSDNSYSPEEHAAKRSFVATAIEQVKPEIVVDFGCNTGEFSELAVRAGARNVVAVDSDPGSLETAVGRIEEQGLPILPLYLDLANPSPSHGWAGRERKPFSRRMQPDFVLCLALLHHLCLGRNVPLADAVDWLIGHAPQGVIEFVPRTDPMAKGLLQFRDELFADYTEEGFRQALMQRAAIVAEQRVTASGRLVLWYRRH